MSSQSVKMPMPLTPDEVKRGIAKRMTESFIQTLEKCGPLNAGVATSFTAEWTIRYCLSDYGLETTGQISGSSGEPVEDGEILEGKIEAMPPDQFRAETEQPIPPPQPTNPKPKEEHIYRANKVGRTKKTS